MKRCEIMDTEENIIETYLVDAIGRNEDVHSFIDLLSSINGNMTLSIDGKWGSGKTFFVKQTQIILDSLNPNSTIYNHERGEKIRKYWESKNKNKEIPPVITVYYDAWSHDNDNDPLLSLVYEIMCDKKWGIAPENKKDWTKILASIEDFVTGRNISEVLKNGKGEDLFCNIKDQREISHMISTFFESLLPEHGNALVIFIDELDRCSPQYAVKLLERVKHYLNLPNIHFVFSINPSELQHTIKKNYGDEFDAGRYLDRFFDLRIALPPVDVEKYIRLLGEGGRENLRESICKEIIRKMGFEMREISRFLPISKRAAYKVTDMENERRNSLSDDEGYGEFICMSVILPIAIGLKLYDSSQYEDFVNGRDSHWLYEIVNNEEHRDWIGNLVLTKDESFGNINGRTHVEFQSRVEEIYEAVFVRKYTRGDYRKKIGKSNFDANSKISILQAISLLSKYSKIE